MASTAAAAQSQRAATSSSQTPPAAATVAAIRPKSTTNGVSNPQAQKPSTTVSGTNGPNSHAHDRLLFLVANFIGSTATLTTASGDRFTGVFSTPSLEPPELKYALKMTKQLGQSTTDQDSASYVGIGEDHVMLFDVKDVIDLAVANVALDKVQLKASNGASTGFRTDTDISGNTSRAERELTRWEPSAGGDLNNVTFSNSGRTWDQFEANERLYGVKTDYNENIYTTTIDTKDPSYRARLANADRLAREIESTASSNIHQAEERGLVDEANRDVDEEERYSGVRRDLNTSTRPPNTYTPPARRAPTGQPTVSGAPVDPAIISSQLARPGAPSKPSQTTETANAPKSAEAAAKENAPPTSQTSADSNRSRTAALEKAALDRPGQNGHLLTPIAPNTAAATTSKERPSSGANATQTVERDVLKSFKDFSANEKLRMQERQRAAARKEKDVKLNDLKHWGMNFKLKNEVPPDMLGILAKDKQKQAEILEKAKRQALEKQQAEATKSSPASTTASQAPAADAPANPTTAPNAPQGSKASRPPTGQPVRTFQSQNVPSMPPPRQTQTGNLGQRLQAQMQQQQQQQQQQQSPRAPPSGPAALDTSSTRGGAQTPSSAVSTKFNPAAFEFRPNPAATSFSPTNQPRVPATASPAKSGTAAPVKPASFFGNKRPTGPKKSIRDGFNPIKRMKKEAESADENKRKAWAANGGIPHAYDTNPRWTVTKENEEKKMTDCFSRQGVQMSAPLPISGAMPYADQLPPHVQQISGPPHINVPPQGPQQFQQFPHREHQFDGQRMHQSSYSSPRVQQPQMMMQPSPMMGHAQPFGQVMQQFPIGGQPMFMRTPSQQFQGQHMATPMMQNHSGGAPYMGMPGGPQGMQMYPQQFQFVPAQGPGGSGAYGSPRGAPMMVHQGSQQGQAPQFMIPGQPGQQMYVQQHPQQMMRPGMQQQQQQQQPFGSPHMAGQHFPGQSHRGNSFNSNTSFNGNQFSQPQTPQMGQAPLPGHPQAPGSSGGPTNGQEEAK